MLNKKRGIEVKKVFINESVLQTYLAHTGTKFYFLFLIVILLVGLIGGTFLACNVEANNEKIFIPMFFSGIPVVGGDFFSAFSTFLLNALINLLFLFLSGTTALGFLVIPFLILFKGFSVGVAAVSFLNTSSQGLLRSAVVYMPAMATLSLVIVVFALCAFIFSKSFSKSFFSSGKVETLNFTDYLKIFFLFLSFSVMISFLGAVITIIYPLIFS